MASEPVTERERVPWRTILAAIVAVLGTLASLTVLRHLTRLIAWVAVAGFLATVLNPAVDFLQRRARLRRGLASVTVLILVLAATAGMVAAFLTPIVDQTREFAKNLPELVEDAEAGRGTIGELVQRFNLDEFVRDNQAKLESFTSDLGKRVPGILASVFSTVYAGLTILVLTILFLTQGPNLVRGVHRAIPPLHQERAAFVGADVAKAMSGYMYGNFLISIIAGIASYTFFRTAGVPYPEVLALWVAFTDLIPLVGATLGAIPTVVLSFLDSTTAGVAAVIFFVIYQQFENHVLQVTVMAKTVNVNPLTVLLSVIAGIELFGYVGALLAIPAAGALQVIFKDLFDERLHVRRTPPTATTPTPPS